MTEEELKKIQLLADMDDWEQVFDHSVALKRNQYRIVDGCFWTSIATQMPQYLHSWDAIIPLIKKQDMTIQHMVHDNLQKRIWCCELCEPREMADALLESHGYK